MASGSEEDFKPWDSVTSNLSKAKLTSYEKYKEVMDSVPSKPQHMVVPDEKLTAFMTLEDFNRKWGL